jgi:hypothetical protein
MTIFVIGKAGLFWEKCWFCRYVSSQGAVSRQGFSLQERNKTNKQTSLSPFSPSLPSFRSIIAAASLRHPQQTKLSPNFKKIVLLGISNFQTIESKTKPPIKKILKKKEKPPRLELWHFW